MGESREYDIENLSNSKVEHSEEYVYITQPNGVLTQVKFEDFDFLVIDSFDKDGNHLDMIGNHTFGEELED
jgi:hypothetical protein